MSIHAQGHTFPVKRVISVKPDPDPFGQGAPMWDAYRLFARLLDQVRLAMEDVERYFTPHGAPEERGYGDWAVGGEEALDLFTQTERFLARKLNQSAGVECDPYAEPEASL